MSRPTEDRKDKVIKVRISAEKYDELMKEGKNLSETIRRKLNGESFVPHNRELEGMANCMNMTYDELLSGVTELMLAGEITVSRGNVGIQIPLWAERFTDVCHDKGLEVEKVAESAIKAVEKGLL